MHFEPNTFIGKALIGIVAAIWFAIFYSVVLSYSTQFFHPINFRMPNGELLGGDFMAFYTAGKLYWQNPDMIYDWPKAIQWQRDFMGADYKGALVFAYPPFMLLLFAPLALLPFQLAAYSWCLVSFLLGLLSVFLIAESYKCSLALQTTSCLFLIAFVPFSIYCIAGGQTAAMGMYILSLYLHQRRKQNDLAAGLFLGLGVYKPPLFFLIGLALVIERKWKIVIGALLTISVMTLLSLAVIGWSGLEQYLSSLTKYIYGREVLPQKQLPIDQGVGLLSLLFNAFKGKPAFAWLVYSVLYLGYLAYLGSGLKKASSKSFSIYREASIIGASLLFSPQMLKYDVAILAIPALVVILEAWSFKAEEKFLNSNVKFVFILTLLVSLLILPTFSFDFFHMTIKGTSVLLLLWIVAPLIMERIDAQRFSIR